MSTSDWLHGTGLTLAALLAGGVAMAQTQTPAPQPAATGTTAAQAETPAPKKRAGSAGSASAASSPFSGLFGGGDPVKDGPVDLNVTVSDGDTALARQLRNASLVTGALQEGRYTGQDVLAAARADYARILATMYDNGFYSAEIDIRLDGVEAAGIAPLDAPKVIRRVDIAVRPGPKFTYARADIAPVAPGTELPKDYRRGEVARTSTMKAAARAGVEGWREQGHAKAAVAATDITAHHDDTIVDSRIALDPGPAVRFGQMTIAGAERIRPDRLRAIAGFPTGQRFDPEKLDHVRKRLRRTGVFSAITLEEAEALGPSNTLDVALTVIEQKPRRLGAGFEISSVDGAMVSGYWMHRNLLGGAERLRLDARVSDIGSGTSGRDITLGARLERPATLSPDTTAFVDAKVARLREEDYDQDLGVLGIGAQWLPSDRLSGDVKLEYRRSRVKDASGTTDFEVLALPVTVTWDKRDEPTDARTGYWLSGGLTPFVGRRDTGSGLRAEAEGRAYRSFGAEDKLTLAGRARFGTVLGPELAETPRDYLFFSGGGGSVRGQPFQSLGVNVVPGISGGTVKTGGMSVVNATAEIRYQLREKIGLAAFADAGRVWADQSWQGDSAWHAGAGIGVRYKTPIGPLRFDVAGPVGGDTGSGVQVYLGLGQAF